MTPEKRSTLHKEEVARRFVEAREIEQALLDTPEGQDLLALVSTTNRYPNGYSINNVGKLFLVGGSRTLLHKDIDNWGYKVLSDNKVFAERKFPTLQLMLRGTWEMIVRKNQPLGITKNAYLEWANNPDNGVIGAKLDVSEMAKRLTDQKGGYYLSEENPIFNDPYWIEVFKMLGSYTLTTKDKHGRYNFIIGNLLDARKDTQFWLDLCRCEPGWDNFKDDDIIKFLYGYSVSFDIKGNISFEIKGESTQWKDKWRYKVGGIDKSSVETLLCDRMRSDLKTGFRVKPPKAMEKIICGLFDPKHTFVDRITDVLEKLVEKDITHINKLHPYYQGLISERINLPEGFIHSSMNYKNLGLV